ncbi:MAG: hypothetical protein KBT63_00235 [Porticoccaceae bacterium]|nr:hypothetical protein [Porticoccaceae bacterium]
MKKVFYLAALLAGMGSFLAIMSGHGGDPLGVWNFRGPMNKGQIFYYILTVSGVIIISPLIDYLLKLKKHSSNTKWERKFIKEIEGGKARRVPPKNSQKPE